MFDFDDTSPNRYEGMSIQEIIDEALGRLDAIVLSPEQAKRILPYRLEMLGKVMETLEPDEFVSDEIYALAEIAASTEPRSFGEVFRRYHISSADQLGMGGVHETSLANDYEGAGENQGVIWSEIAFQEVGIQNGWREPFAPYEGMTDN